MAINDLTALPVSLDLPLALREEIQRHVEAAMGWQVTTSTDLPARLHLYGIGRGAVEVPSILVVTATDEPGAAATAAIGARAVLRWPDDAPSLATTTARLLSSAPQPAVPTLRIAGSAGGVGTSTVALALGGLVAWAGCDVLVASASDLAVPDVPTVSTLRGPRPWEAAVEVVGVPGLRAIRGVDGAVEVTGPAIVVDDTRSTSPHLLVVGADRAGLDAVRSAEVGAVVVVERGPVRTADLAAAAGPRLAAVLPWSHRVARAGLHLRVPASLPGSWLARLMGVADWVARDIAERTDRTPTS
jgi:hypothetical protein